MSSEASPSIESCPTCGRMVPRNAQHGLCRACLLQLAIDPTIDQASGEPVLPSIIGDYELLKEIGRGGMGVVWRARHIKDDRLVAVKMLLAGCFASEEARARFRREAAVLSGLKHPNIVTVHKVGEQDGIPYLAMDLVEGCDLEALLRRSLPTPQCAAHWVATLAEAVSHAHGRGAIHRDIKPANILIDALEQPHLTDFGLAKLIDSSDYLTLTGHAVGSASYMAPEQAAGRNAELTAAVDIYALGAVLYCLLTGRAPFVADSVVATMKLVADLDAIPPGRLNPAVPRELETICLKCLEKLPSRRYASADALAADLRNSLAGRPIAARPISVLDRTLKVVRRNPVVSGVSALLVISLLAGLVATTRGWHRERRLLVQTKKANELLSHALALRQQREAEASLDAGLTAAGLMTLTRLVQENPSNTLASARLFKVLSGPLPWPVLPSLVHDAPVRYGVVSSNRQWIITATTDGWVHAWNATSAVHHLKIPHDTARGRFALSASGSTLATLATNGLAQVWQMPEGNLLWETASNSSGVVASLLLSRDGATLFTAGTDGIARLWRTLDGRQLASLQHGEALKALSINAANDRMVTIGTNRCVLWRHDLNGWSRISTLDATNPSFAEFSLRGDKLLVAGSNTLQTFEATYGTLLEATDGRGQIKRACFNADGSNIVFSSANRILHLWRGKLLRELPRHRGTVTSLELKGTQWLLSSDSDGEARLMSTSTGIEGIARIQHRAAILDATFDSSRSHVLTVSADRTARLTFVDRPARGETHLPLDAKASLFALSTDAKLVAAAAEDYSVRIFATHDPRRDRDSVQHPAAVTCMAFDPGIAALASGDSSGQVIISHVDTGKLKGLPLTHGGPVRSLHWHSNVLAVVVSNNVTLWESVDGAFLQRAICPTADVQTLDFSPDGTQVVLGALNGMAQMFDSRSGKPRSPALAHPGPVRHARFSLDGTSLATGSDGNAARVWDAENGTPRTRFLQPGADVVCVAFSPDSRKLLTGSVHGTLALWDIATSTALPDLIRSGTAILSAEFSPDGKNVAFSAGRPFVSLYDLASVLPLLKNEEFRNQPQVRFSQDGRRLLILSGRDSAAVYKLPNFFAPEPSVLLAMAEIQLRQRPTAQGGWQDLSPDEFFARQRLVAGRNCHLGPEPQVRVYR